MPYRLSTLAERDLDEIWSDVAEDASPATADRLIDAIIDRFELLVEQSDGSPPAGVRRRRSIVHRRNYVIYYRHERDVVVARVLHGHRDQIAARSEPEVG